jgi:hypothetical protein
MYHMEISDIRTLCDSLGIKMPDQAFSHIECSVTQGKYSFEDAAEWIQMKSDSFKDLYNYRELFREKIEFESKTDIHCLERYAAHLNIEIPPETLEKMKQAIAEGRNSPSQLANYLRGYAYEQFLQSPNVPYLSDAEHGYLKEDLGSFGYSSYLKALGRISRMTSISEPALNHLADRFLRDKPSGMELYGTILSRHPVPHLAQTPAGISAYAKSLGVEMTPEKATFLLDAQLQPDEIRKHIMHASFDNYTDGPNQFAKSIEGLVKTLAVSRPDPAREMSFAL